MTSFADRRLLALLRARNLEGLLGLYDRYGPECLELASQLVHGAPAAEEIVFEVFLRLWQGFPPRHLPIRKWLHDETRHLAGLQRAGVQRSKSGPLR